MTDRKIGEVIDRMIDAIGDNDPVLVVQLQKVKVSAGFLAPEMQIHAWNKLVDVFNVRMMDLVPPWFNEAGKILADRR